MELSREETAFEANKFARALIPGWGKYVIMPVKVREDLDRGCVCVCGQLSGSRRALHDETKMTESAPRTIMDIGFRIVMLVVRIRLIVVDVTEVVPLHFSGEPFSVRADFVHRRLPRVKESEATAGALQSPDSIWVTPGPAETTSRTLISEALPT